GKRRFQHPRLVRLDFGQHLVFSDTPEEHEKGRRSLGDGLTELPYEIVADAIIRERAREGSDTCSGNPTDRHPRKRIQEKKTDQSSPQRASQPAHRRAKRREIHSLM